jgi:hypothetical protein
MDMEKDALSTRRLDRQIRRLSSWSFAEKFPKLALAIVENEAMKKSIDEARPDLVNGRLAKTIRGWRENGVPREDIEHLVRLHLIGLIDDALSLAAAYAHELATGEDLRNFTAECFRQIELRREGLGRFRGIPRNCSPRGPVGRLRPLEGKR